MREMSGRQALQLGLATTAAGLLPRVEPGGRHAHDSHVHVDPFTVTKINGQVLEEPLWRDTFELTGRSGDSFTFESNFVDVTGRYVDHCHVLSHEDLGMMEIVEVIP
jgi:FtsP/CotA-like multicopper oxidase with cupredoxin domain